MAFSSGHGVFSFAVFFFARGRGPARQLPPPVWTSRFSPIAIWAPQFSAPVWAPQFSLPERGRTAPFFGRQEGVLVQRAPGARFKGSENRSTRHRRRRARSRASAIRYPNWPGQFLIARLKNGALNQDPLLGAAAPVLPLSARDNCGASWREGGDGRAGAFQPTLQFLCLP